MGEARSLRTIIANTQLAQDIELATAINQLKATDPTLQNFLQAQQDRVYEKITKQKDDTFTKVYGDLQMAANSQESMMKYKDRSSDLETLETTELERRTMEANKMMEDKNTYKRKYEMNEWSVNNKRDTLFIFSSLFVSLSFIVLCTVLLRMNYISTYTWGILSFLALFIFALIVLNRAYYTNTIRNNRYWNKKNFGITSGNNSRRMCSDGAPPVTN